MALGTIAAMNEPSRDEDHPDFGPSGYLPDRASKRARKIVLRAQMGMHWIWGAVAVGVGVVVVGTIFLFTRGGPPGAPFVELGPIDTFVDGPFVNTDDGLTDYFATTSGRLRIFHVPADLLPIAWCEQSRQFEGPAGVWTATGRGRSGAPSLEEHPTVIVENLVYWDPDATIPGPVPDPLEVPRSC